MRSVIRKLLVLVGVACFVAAFGLPAAEFADIAGTSNGQTGIYAKDARKHLIGTKLQAQAYAGIDFHFDSNVLLRRNDVKSSVISSGILGTRLLYEAPRFNASLLAQVNGKAYSGFSNLSGVTGNADLTGEYTVSDSTKVNLEDVFYYAQDPVDITQDQRAERFDNTVDAVLASEFARWALTAGFVNEVLSYNQSRFHYLNYVMYKGYAEGAFDLPFASEKLNLSKVKGYIRLAVIDYKHPTQDLNDPFVFEAIAGCRGKWKEKFTWDLGAGFDSVTIKKNIDNPADSDKTLAFAFEGYVQYQFDERSMLILAGSRHVGTSPASNYELDTTASLSAQHFFTQRWNGAVSGIYQYAQRSVSNANLTVDSVNVKTAYIVRQGGSSPDVSVYADYTFSGRHGDQKSDQYNDHRVGAGISAIF
ncbi:MAG: hypothetical protein ACREJ2_05570 [Planctomycetota bacterium]